MRPTALATATLLALAASGCTDPYASPTTRTATTATDRVALAARDREYPAQPTPPTRPAADAATPQAALRAFAERSITWTWKTLATQQQQLADAAIGQARDHAQLLATTASHDQEMRRGRITSTGTVQAITRAPGTRDRWVVIIREQPSSENPGRYEQPRAAYHVVVAAVREIAPGRWVVSAWRPQR